jgi:hypothetical protein
MWAAGRIGVPGSRVAGDGEDFLVGKAEIGLPPPDVDRGSGGHPVGGDRRPAQANRGHDLGEEFIVGVSWWRRVVRQRRRIDRRRSLARALVTLLLLLLTVQ